MARGLAWMALTLAVVVAISSILWLAMVRPYLHTRVDGAIAGTLNEVIAPLPAIPNQALQVTGPTLTITDTEANALLTQELPAGTGLDRLGVSFASNTVVLTYSAYGQQGTIQTGLDVQNGQLVAVNTQVSGLLGWVESGDELSATLDQALGALGAKTPHGFQSVSITPGQFTLTLATG